jgi:hypothetical protein
MSDRMLKIWLIGNAVFAVLWVLYLFDIGLHVQ